MQYPGRASGARSTGSVSALRHREVAAQPRRRIACPASPPLSPGRTPHEPYAVDQATRRRRLRNSTGTDMARAKSEMVKVPGSGTELVDTSPKSKPNGNVPGLSSWIQIKNVYRKLDASPLKRLIAPLSPTDHDQAMRLVRRPSTGKRRLVRRGPGVSQNLSSHLVSDRCQVL
jgi:hypothetical protein